MDIRNQTKTRQCHWGATPIFTTHSGPDGVTSPAVYWPSLLTLTFTLSLWPFVHSIHFHVPQCSLISHVRSDGLRSQCVCVCFNGGASIHFVPMLWDQVTVSDWIEDIHRKYAKHILSADSRIYTFVRVSVCVNHARAAFLVSVLINFVVQTQKHSRRRDEQKKTSKSQKLSVQTCAVNVSYLTLNSLGICVYVFNRASGTPPSSYIM